VAAPKPRRRLLDVPTAAEITGLTEDKIRAEARSGRLPSLKMGKYVRIDAADLDAWIDSHYRPSPTRHPIRRVK
jgi:excisionase family DNA binding protein